MYMKNLSSHYFFGKTSNKKLANYYSKTYSSFSKQQPSDILEGKFNYNEAFEAFVKGTRQKEESASVIGAFTRKLQEKSVFLVKQQPVKVADIGCADSSTCLKYLRSMNCQPGFNYFGIDTNQKFLREAKTRLMNDSIIKNYTLVNCDALSGELKQRGDLTAFEFIFVSHIAYYLKNQLAGRAFLEDITKLLSEQCGIAVFLHEDSTYYFRSTYNKTQFHTATPVLLEKSAQDLPANFNQFKSISFTSKLHFPLLRKELWEAAKYPYFYKDHAHEPNFIDMLKKLTFIVQRDLIGLANEGSLAAYVNEIRDAISDNNNCLDLETRMQTLVSPQCTLRHKIARALKETEEEMATILGKEISIKEDSTPIQDQNPSCSLR